MEASKVYQMYQAGVNYNNRLEPNYYDDIDTNYDFFHGLHWRGLELDEDSDLPQPVLNFIRRFITFFVASLTTSNLKIHMTPYIQSQDEIVDGVSKYEASELINNHIEFLLEKFKMEYRLREACFDAAITGDACAHFFFDAMAKPYGNESGGVEGEISMELVDGVNVFFGNPNNSEVQLQPYVLITGRDTVDNLRKEAIDHGMDEQSANAIKPDSEYIYQSSENSRIENEDIENYGKALFIYCYRRSPEGTILVSKSTPDVMIFDEVNTGLTKYPVAWMNWERKKNTYHGKSVATELIPTQVFINKMAAMIMYHLMMSAFPKIVYDQNILPDGVDNRVGRSIGIDGLGIDRPINTIIDQIQPAVMSPQIIQALDTIVNYFKEAAGITDAALGNERPNNTSALIAVQQASSIPLGNIAANMNEWMEDIGEIILDMMATYYGTRPIMMKNEQGRELKEFNFDNLQKFWFNVNCDVGESTKYSEITAVQTLSNLLSAQYIDFIQFLERVPDAYIPDRASLVDEIQKKMDAQQPQVPGMQPPQGSPAPAPVPPVPQGADKGASPLAGLSETELAAFNKLDPAMQQKLLEDIASQA
jgi:hypothetical protein